MKSINACSKMAAPRRPLARLAAALSWLSCLLLLAACGGSGGEPTPVAAAAEQVETGKTIQANNWTAELIGPPEQIKVIGEGNITYQADGNFLVVFLKLTNQGDQMQVVARDLFKVRDGQGQEYDPARSAVQVAFVLQRGMQLSLDSPLAADATRDSVIIFDVPEDAAGLELMMDGAEDTLALGF
jgi:hypothetical protein